MQPRSALIRGVAARPCTLVVRQLKASTFESSCDAVGMCPASAAYLEDALVGPLGECPLCPLSDDEPPAAECEAVGSTAAGSSRPTITDGSVALSASGLFAVRTSCGGVPVARLSGYEVRPHL